MKLSIFNLHRPALSSLEQAAQTPDGASTPQAQSPVQAQDAGFLLTFQLRRKLLNRLLSITIVLGGIIFLLLFPLLVEANNWLALVFFSLVLLGMIGLRFVLSIPYSTRAAGFLGLLSAAACFLIANKSLAGNGQLLLLLIPLLAILLIGEGRSARPARVILLTLAILLLSATALLTFRAYLPSFDPGIQTYVWMITGFGFGLIVIAGSLAFNAHQRSLEAGLDEKEKGITAFAEENAQLASSAAQSNQALEHRLLQIRTAAEINGTVSSTLELDRLLSQVCDLVCERFGYYYVGVFLIPPGSEEAVLASGTGEAGRRMVAAGHRLQVGGDFMIGWATANLQPRIALDINREDGLTSVVRFNNPYLPDTRSELALPIISKQSVLGALTIQSTVEAAFDQDDITVLQSIASSLANAIENARLFGQIQSNLMEISTLHRQYLRREWIQVLEAQGPQQYSFNSRSDLDANASPAQLVEIPVRLRDQQIGILTLEPDPTRPVGSDELALIESVVSQAAFALENARLLERTRQRAD